MFIPRLSVFVTEPSRTIALIHVRLAFDPFENKIPHCNKHHYSDIVIRYAIWQNPKGQDH